MWEKAKQLMGETWSVYRKNFVSILLLVVLVCFPLNAVRAFLVEPLVDWESLNALLAENGTMSGVAQEDSQAVLQQLQKEYLLYLGITAVLSLLGLVSSLGILKLSYATHKGEAVEFSDLFASSISQLVKGIGTDLYTGFFISLGLVCFFLPGMYLYLLALFAMPVVAITGISGKKALRLSATAVRRRMKECIVFALATVVFRFGFLEAAGYLVGLLPLQGVIQQIVMTVYYTLSDLILALPLVATALAYCHLGKEEDWALVQGNENASA